MVRHAPVHGIAMVRHGTSWYIMGPDDLSWCFMVMLWGAMDIHGNAMDFTAHYFMACHEKEALPWCWLKALPWNGPWQFHGAMERPIEFPRKCHGMPWHCQALPWHYRGVCMMPRCHWGHGVAMGYHDIATIARGNAMTGHVIALPRQAMNHVRVMVGHGEVHGTP